MLKNRFKLIKLTLVALIAALATQANAEWKNSYNAQGNNVGMLFRLGWSGPIMGSHTFPRGTANIFKTGRWNWGIMTARDLDGDGTAEDTMGHPCRGCLMQGMNSSLESYDELAAAFAAGESMDQAANRIDHNRVQVSTDADDLAEWYPEFREGRTASGAPILHGAETIVLRQGDAMNGDGQGHGLSQEFRFHLLNYGESNNMVYGHMFLRNMSEYIKWNPVAGFRDRVANTPDGQMWHEMTFHYLVANGGYIGVRDEGWAFHNPSATHVICDRDGIEDFQGPPFMVAHALIRAPEFKGEKMVPTNLIEHGWSTEFGFGGSEDVMESGYSFIKTYNVSLGKGHSEYIWTGTMSPWNGKQIFGWPGLLDPGDSRYNQWIWGERNAYNHYQFWGAVHNVAPRDSMSCDFVIMFVYPANSPFTMPRSEIAFIDDPEVQSQLQPVHDYREVARLVFEGGYIVPETPSPPSLTVIPGNEQVTITWSDINIHTPDAYYSFLQKYPELDPNGVYREYDFEGYRLYRSYVGPSDSHSELIFECSKSAGDITFYYIDRSADDTPLYRMSNGMKIWYALVPYDLNYDVATGESFSLPELTSGKVWNKPGPGGLYSVIPHSDASNFKAADLNGFSYVGPATEPNAYVELSGDGAGKLTEAPKLLQPQLDFTFEAVNNERIATEIKCYVACTGIEVAWGCSYWAYPQRVISLLDVNGNVMSTGSPFLTRDAEVEQVLTNTPDANGVDYAVHVLYNRSDIPVGNRDYAPVYIDFNTGGYAGASVANQYGSCVDSRIGTGPSIGSYIKTGVFEVTWKAVAGDMTVEVTDKLRGGTVPFSPYREDAAWGFMPDGTYMDFFDEVKAGVSKSERANLMLDKIPADNTDEFALALNGIVWAFTDITSMPAAGTVMTVTNCFGTWNGDQTVFTQYCDAPYPGDKWEIKVKPMSQDPEDAQMEKISVVPNPYIATSFLDLSPDSRRIEFVNLPDRCTIRIFSLGGHLVNVLNHIGANRHGWGNYDDWDRLDANSQPKQLTGYDNHGGTEPWNLRNRFGQTVASGLYFYHVTDSRGETYTGKFYVVN